MGGIALADELCCLTAVGSRHQHDAARSRKKRLVADEPMNFRLKLGTSSACLCAMAAAGGQQFVMPSDNELRTAYCVPVINATIDMDNQVIAALEANSSSTPEGQQRTHNALDLARESLAKTQQIRSRLQLYLAPKVETLDPAALHAAMSRGEADMAQLKASSERCAAKCSTVTAPSADQMSACTASCTDPDLVARVRACRNPTWLPY